MFNGAGIISGHRSSLLFVFFNDTAPTEIYTLPLHDALPICASKNWAMAGVSLNQAVDAAPTLDNSKIPTLTSENEDAGAPSGAVGTLVSSLVDFASPGGQVDNVTDPDSGAQLGIAITAVDSTNGSWYYTTNNGSTCTAMG